MSHKMLVLVLSIIILSCPRTADGETANPKEDPDFAPALREMGQIAGEMEQIVERQDVLRKKWEETCAQMSWDEAWSEWKTALKLALRRESELSRQMQEDFLCHMEQENLMERPEAQLLLLPIRWVDTGLTRLEIVTLSCGIIPPWTDRKSLLKRLGKMAKYEDYAAAVPAAVEEDAPPPKAAEKEKPKKKRRKRTNN